MYFLFILTFSFLFGFWRIMLSLNQKNLRGLCFAGATSVSSVVVFSANPAQAETFTINGTDCNITTHVPQVPKNF